MFTYSEHSSEEEVEFISPSESLPLEPQPSSPVLTDDPLTRSQAFNLYTSHLLSTWNARTYEFAAIIFTAAAYPDTLTASAIRGIITTLASIAFSAALGRWIDRAPDRLATLLSTIAANRLSVLAACTVWVFIIDAPSAGGGVVLLPARAVEGGWKRAFFAVVLGLGVVERLSGVANMLVMERDWVVAVAAGEGEVYDLTRLNAAMRRIDLGCKLVAPIALSGIVSASGSVRIGVLVVGGMSVASWGVEWWCAGRVWRNNSKLRQPKIMESVVDESAIVNAVEELPALSRVTSRGNRLAQRTRGWLLRYARDFRQYFSSQVWIPSFALSLLHLSALSYSATFITYLLNVGFSLNLITIARAVGSVVEISSTLVTPFGVEYLGKAYHHHHQQSTYEDEDSETALLEGPSEPHGNTETGLERLGLWGITWQLLNLIPVVLSLWALSPAPNPSSLPSILSPLLSTVATTALGPTPIALALALFAFLSLSRLGLWIFDLTTQQLTQTLAPPSTRSSFAGVENSLVSAFELGQHIATMVLSRPDQFKWLAAGSWAAVAVSAVLYAGWVRWRRGHLLHWERVGCGKGCGGEGR